MSRLAVTLSGIVGWQKNLFLRGKGLFCSQEGNRAVDRMLGRWTKGAPSSRLGSINSFSHLRTMMTLHRH